MKKWISSAAAATVLASTLLFSPTGASANIGDQTLRPTMTHYDVLQLQTLLKQKGYLTYGGSLTKYYGTSTTGAVKRFQSAKGLTADGISGRNTFNKLGVYHVNTASLVSYAKKFIGVPYKWGGTSPAGFDCSGYIYYVFKNSQGVALPRTAASLFSNVGLKVSAPVVGDLVFFQTYSTGPSHVGIYLGNNQFISATSSKGIKIDYMNSTYWKPRYLGAKTL